MAYNPLPQSPILNPVHRLKFLRHLKILENGKCSKDTVAVGVCGTLIHSLLLSVFFGEAAAVRFIQYI